MNRLAVLLLVACSGAGPVPVKPSPTGGGAGAGSSSGGGSSGGGSAGSGGGAPLLTEQWSSGTRLKVRTLSDSNGGTALGGWHDSQLDERCYFMTAADGQLRCVPWLVPYAAEGMFTDSGCTQAAVVAQASCGGTPRHAIRYADTSGCLKVRVFSVGGAASALYARAGASCNATPLQPGQRVFTLGAELAASSLVSATVTKGTGAGFGLNGLTASDGARGTLNYRDTTNGTDCYAQRTSDGAIRCLPTPTSYSSGVFASGSCSSPAFLVAGTCAMAAPALGATLASSSVSCARDWEFSRLGAELQSYWSGAACTNNPVSTGVRAFAAGAAIPSSALPTATSTRTAAGRLEHLIAQWPGGQTTAFGWRDTQLDVDCQVFYSAADGSRRCLPVQPGVSLSGYYGDSSCTQPLASVDFVGSGCSPRFAVEYFDTCQVRVRVHRVGARHTGAVYSKGTTCTAQANITSTLYATTGEVAPSELAALGDTLR